MGVFKLDFGYKGRRLTQEQEVFVKSLQLGLGTEICQSPGRSSSLLYLCFSLLVLSTLLPLLPAFLIMCVPPSHPNVVLTYPTFCLVHPVPH